jgi:hypothetical protein
MSRGGDRRPIRLAHGDVALGMTLIAAMLRDRTSAGRRFAKEHEQLFQRWRRLVHARRDAGGGRSP